MTSDPQTLAILREALAALAVRRHPRNGKIARLPEATRNLINQMLEDGFLYRAIIQKLQKASPPLPYPISEMNISNWRKGGYQDWLRRPNQDFRR
jgi:hypothetical protein